MDLLSGNAVGKGRNASEVWCEDSSGIKNLRLKYKRKQEFQTGAKAKLSGIPASLWLGGNYVNERCCLDSDGNENIVFILDIYAIRRYNLQRQRKHIKLDRSTRRRDIFPVEFIRMRRRDRRREDFSCRLKNPLFFYSSITWISRKSKSIESTKLS